MRELEYVVMSLLQRAVCVCVWVAIRFGDKPVGRHTVWATGFSMHVRCGPNNCTL